MTLKEKGPLYRKNEIDVDINGRTKYLLKNGSQKVFNLILYKIQNLMQRWYFLQVGL